MHLLALSEESSHHEKYHHLIVAKEIRMYLQERTEKLSGKRTYRCCLRSVICFPSDGRRLSLSLDEGDPQFSVYVLQCWGCTYCYSGSEHPPSQRPSFGQCKGEIRLFFVNSKKIYRLFNSNTLFQGKVLAGVALPVLLPLGNKKSFNEHLRKHLGGIICLNCEVISVYGFAALKMHERHVHPETPSPTTNFSKNGRMLSPRAELMQHQQMDINAFDKIPLRDVCKSENDPLLQVMKGNRVLNKTPVH
jgi:hypothetical protein